ncbi:hypothetical protein DdX_21741 [Ditylenchus destructor]|uniref:Uncharacterized protein n=1 Tax=Ditylenchus destructor TaxID=166010 RepID=A0AAD4MF87_9BILA|nr:hypothetical protein DdX_21741 [Ditylenchus destructor]
MTDEKRLSISAKISYKSVQPKPGTLEYDAASSSFILSFPGTVCKVRLGLKSEMLKNNIPPQLPNESKVPKPASEDTNRCATVAGPPTESIRHKGGFAMQKQIYPTGTTEVNGQLGDDSAPATNKAVKQELDESKAEMDAAQMRVKNLEESTCDLEKKLQSSEAEKQQLTNELHTLEAKNQESLERIRKLEQELSNSQDKIRDLEAKFAQTEVGQVLAVMKEKVDKLENGEISRLQKEVAKLSNENAKVKLDLCNSQKRLNASEKQNSDIIQDKAKMEEQLAGWQRYHRDIWNVAKFGDEISKENQEPTNSESWQQCVYVPRRCFGNVVNEQNHESGSIGEPAKRARIDTKKEPDEDDAKNATNVASGSKAVMNS